MLLAGGHWVRSGGRARLSVLVDERWRAETLAAEFALRGVGAEHAVLAATVAPTGVAVRSAFSPALLERAESWMRGARESPPPGFVLGAGGLRLWAIAAGRADRAGFLLGTGPPHGAVHAAAGAQLARMGLAAVAVSQRGGPGWRVSSLRRIRRLAELLGEPPPGGAHLWPAVR